MSDFGRSSTGGASTDDLAGLQAEVDALETELAILEDGNSTDEEREALEAQLDTARLAVVNAQKLVDQAQDAGQLVQNQRLDALEALKCEPVTTPPLAAWAHTGAVVGTSTLAFGAAGAGGGSAKHTFTAGRLKHRHTFDFSYGLNADSAADLVIRVEVFDGTNLLISDLFSTKTAALSDGSVEFFPVSSDISVVITDVVGASSRDMRTTAMTITAHCSTYAHGTVKQAKEDFIATNQVPVKKGDYFESFPDGTTSGDIEPQVITTDSSGLYRVGVFDEVINVGAGDTSVPTGFDLSQPDLYIEFEFSDNGGTGRSWQTGKHRVAHIIERFNAGDSVDSYQLNFDNDFVVLNLIDINTGEFAMRYSGRDVGVTRIELYQLAQEVPAIIPVSDFTVFTTTGAFQPIGDANELFTNEDGARVTVEFGDGNRDTLTFFDGIARDERKGFDTNDLELQIVDGQISIKDNGNSSGIAKAWYQLPLRHSGNGALTLSDNAKAQGYSLDAGALDAPSRNVPISNAAELERLLKGKVHAIYAGGIADLSSNSKNATTTVGDNVDFVLSDEESITFAGNAHRVDLNTDSAEPELHIFASVRVAHTGSFSVFGGNSETFIPLAHPTTAGTDVGRISGSPQAFAINGVSEFADRTEVFDAFKGGSEFVRLEVPSIPSGAPISIGDHIANNAFSFFGDWGRTVITTEPLTDQEKVFVESFQEYGFTENTLAGTPEAFDIAQVDTATSVRVFNWSTGNANQITSSAFYVSDDPNSLTPLESIQILSGETKTLYMVGPISTSDVGGVEFTLTNTDGTLTATHVRQQYLSGNDWENTTFNQLTGNNATVGEIEQSSIEYVFTGSAAAASSNALTIFAVGAAWFGHHVSAKPDKVILNGETFTGTDYPELVALNLAFITDNGDGTYTNTWGNDFPRPVIAESELGVHIDDTTAANGLRGTFQSKTKTNTAANGGAHRYSSSGTTANLAVSITSTDTETAPNHRGLLIGVWAKPLTLEL